MSRPLTLKYLDEIQLGFNQHDVDAILSHFATDCVWLMAGVPIHRRVDAVSGKRRLVPC